MSSEHPVISHIVVLLFLVPGMAGLLLATPLAEELGLVGEARGDNGYDMSHVVAMWKMDEDDGTTIYDASEYDNDGNIDGAQWTEGMNGSALRFDGSNDDVSIPNSDELVFGTSNFTIETWIYPTAYTGNNGLNAILTKHAGSGDTGSWLFRVRIHNEVPKLNFGGMGWDTNFHGNDEITLNEWHHAALVRQGDNFSFYHNGEFDGSYEKSDDLSSTTGILISDQHNVNGERFTGTIDEMVIHNKALTPDEFYGLHFVPDLTLDSDDITILDASPTVGDTVTIEAVVHNIGNTSMEHWQITDDSVDYNWPSYSDSGEKIVYMYSGGGENSYIYSMNFDGSGKTKLTNKENGEYEVYPDTSTDGTLISYEESKSGGNNFDIYVMHLDGSSKTQVSNHSKRETHQTFGFDDNYMTYSAEQDGSSNYDIWVMKKDGDDWDTNATAYQVTNDEIQEYMPVLFPGNDKIIYVKNNKLWTATRDGEEWDEGVTLEQLTTDSADYDRADISPNGRKILTVSQTRDGGDKADLWLMNSDASNAVQLTTENFHQSYPRFNTDASKIIYSSYEDGGSYWDIW